MPDFNIVRRAVVTSTNNDSNDVRVQQVGFDDNAINAEVWAPFGVSYNVSVGSQGILIRVGPDSANNIFLPDRSQDRIKGLKEGETAFFNPISKSRAIYLENGDIAVTTEGTKGDMITTIKGDNTVSIGGACNIIVDGNCNLTADDVDITASGNVDISSSGTVDISGSGSVSISGSTVNLN